MPRARTTIRVLSVAASLVAVLGLAMFLSRPQAAIAQESTTTTVADDTTSTVTDDGATDSTEDESADDSATTDGARRTDHNCDDATQNGSSDGSS